MNDHRWQRDWTIRELKKLTGLKSPILFVGLPGIGNVGKVAADFAADEVGATTVAEFFSYALPHSVFVNENNLVEAPTITLHLKRTNGKHDFLFLLGDVQPIDERGCYGLSEAVIDLFERVGGEHIVTLGGIGLRSIPKKPKVYCSGNTRAAVKQFSKHPGVNATLYGVVGPIVGVSGVIVGLAKKRNIPAVTLLAETYGHPMYLGVKGAQELLKILNKQYALKLNLKELSKEIAEIEQDVLERTEGMFEGDEESPMPLPGKMRWRGKKGETSYIG